MRMSTKRLVKTIFLGLFSFLSFICPWSDFVSFKFGGGFSAIDIFKGIGAVTQFINIGNIDSLKLALGFFIILPAWLMLVYLILVIVSPKLEQSIGAIYRWYPWIAFMMYVIFGVILQIKSSSLPRFFRGGIAVNSLYTGYWAFLLCTLICGILALNLYSKKTLESMYANVSDLERPDWIPSGHEIKNKAQGVKQVLVSPSEGRIYAVSGEYNGAKFPMKDGEELIFGRDAATCHIILKSTSISRRHMSIFFNGKTNHYIVVDYSTNGVFYDEGTRLPHNKPVEVRRGTVIRLGKSDNKFRLE